MIPANSCKRFSVELILNPRALSPPEKFRLFSEKAYHDPTVIGSMMWMRANRTCTCSRCDSPKTSSWSPPPAGSAGGPRLRRPSPNRGYKSASNRNSGGLDLQAIGRGPRRVGRWTPPRDHLPSGFNDLLDIVRDWHVCRGSSLAFSARSRPTRFAVKPGDDGIH